MADHDQQVLQTYRTAFDFALAKLIDTLFLEGAVSQLRA
jgi:hypothetical protein